MFIVKKTEFVVIIVTVNVIVVLDTIMPQGRDVNGV